MLPNIDCDNSSFAVLKRLRETAFVAPPVFETCPPLQLCLREISNAVTPGEVVQVQTGIAWLR